MRHAGAVRRISVAVLVDGITIDDGGGALAWQPRPAEELAALRDLVTAAIGYDEARGDVVTVESMAFQATGMAGELVEEDRLARFLERNGMELAQSLVLAIVAVILAVTVIRPILSRGTGTDAMSLPGTAGLPDPAASPVARLAGALGEDPEDQAAGRVLAIPDRESLLRTVAERPAQSAAMLREWLETGDEEAA